MRLKKSIFALVAMLWCLTFSAYSQSAKIGDATYATLDAAISAANSMTGDVTVEVYGKLDYADATAALGGAYNKISFVGKSSDAEISITRNGSNGYISGSTAGNDCNVSFSNLILSKPAGCHADDAGFMNMAFTVYRVGSVSYTDCTFPNGACGAGCPTTYTGCTFQKSHDKYSFWAYGTDVTIDSCVFDDDRGIKMYAEGGAKTTEVTVKNSDFSKLTGKPAIVLTYGESITLKGNTYSDTGVLELEDNGSSNGTTITSDKTVTCVSDAYPNGCGVIVDGQIYRTVSDAAAVATAGETVQVLYSTTDTAEFAEGVTLELASGVTAPNVTVEGSAVAKIGEVSYAYTKEVDGNVRVWGEAYGVNASESLVFKLYAGETLIATTNLNNIGNIIDGDIPEVTWNFFYPSSTDEYWTTTWEEGHPNSAAQPTKVEMYVDGTLVDTDDAKMSGADDLNPVVWRKLGGVAIADLEGEGTEASPYLITDKEELVWFASDVNEGNNYSGKYVQLVNDIDLEQNDWTPIGNSTYPFMGTFDGNEKNISNLWVTVSGNAGLFGQVAKQTEYVSGTVKDLTVNNATIIASGQNNAGLIAFAPLGARINNVHLTGEVTIQGYRGVGGIVGNGFPQMDGCSVVAEGTITATYWGAGGILGFASDAGAKVTNSTVTSIGQGLTIRGELGGVGAVSGTPHGAKVNGAEITGVVIASNNNYYMGYVDAGGNVENVTVEDVAVKVNGEEIVGCDAVASIGTKGYFSLSSAFAAAQAGQTITLLSDVTLTEALTLPAGITFNGGGFAVNGTLTAGGNLTFEGHTKVSSFNPGWYDHTITIGEGACLELTGTGRMTIGYGNIFNITGSVDNAKTADKATLTASLIIPGGVSITGGNDAAFNVKNAYVKIGTTTSKNSVANGTFTFDFDNSVVDFTNQFTLSEPTSGKTPTFNLNIKNSVVTTATKLIVAAPQSIVVVDNSTVTLGTYFRNSGTFTLQNGSELTGSMIQFGENGGNDGDIIVDNSTLTINNTSAGHAMDGNGTGSLTLKNGATANVGYITESALNLELGSSLTSTSILGENTITVDATGFDGTETPVITSEISENTTVSVTGGTAAYKFEDGKIVIIEKTLAGEGTEASPYLINNKEDLLFFAKKVNAGETYSGKYIQLVNDIDLADETWTPIGNNTNKFAGFFDGNNKTISNITVSSTTNYVGFFGYIKGTGMSASNTPSVKDLKLVNVDIQSTGNYVGGLSGQGYTCNITNVSVQGKVAGNRYVGGLVGHVYTYFKNCSFEGEVTCTFDALGGIAGAGDCRAYDCSVIGTVSGSNWVGGIVGNGQEGTSAVGCYVKAIVSTSTNFYRGVGGIAGVAGHGYESSEFKNNYFDGEVYLCNEKVDAIIAGFVNADTNADIKTTVEGNSWNTQYYSAETPAYVVGTEGLTSNATADAWVSAAVAEKTTERNNNLVMLESDLQYVDAKDVANVTKMSFSTVADDAIAAKVAENNLVAQIGDVKYASLNEAFAAATDGQTITLLSDATPALSSQLAITKASVIDLGGKTLTLTEDDLYFGTTTFKNGTIVVDSSVKPSTAVFWMFANQTLTFDAVKIVATGVTGTYLIGLDGANANLNLLNGSEILVENTTALDLDIICVNSNGVNNIVIDNSKVNVTNLDGRVFFRGNYTVSGGSEIVLDGITKAGFRIEAGQTLSIEDTSSVTITGEPRDGGIHLTDATATYTKAETATVNSTVNAPVIAKIGSVEYASLQAAVAVAQAGDTITLLSDVTLSEIVELPAGIIFNGNDKTITGTIKAGGNLTFAGNTTVGTFSPGWYNNTITIGKGASLKVATGRMTVSYGNIFNIVGSIENAKTADKTAITPSLELVAGISFNGDGARVQFNVENAYVKLGDSSTKQGGATGEFNMNFDNSIVDFTKTLKTYMPNDSGLAPVFNVNATNNSVVSFASHLELWLDNTALTLDNSNLTVVGSFANAGVVTVKGGANFVVNAPIMSSHGGNTGTISVENSTFELKDGNQDWENAGVMKVAVGGKFITNDFKCVGDGKMVVDAANLQGETVVIDGNGVYNFEGVTTVENGDMANVSYKNGDVTLNLKSLEGEGTAEDPHTISNVNDLRLFAMSVKAGNNYAGKHVKLGASVDLSAQAVMLMSTEVTPNWEAIGTNEAPFKGTFDGNNETISNMIVVGEKNQGFFGFADNATIKNLKLNNVTVIGTDCVGAVAGQVYSVSLVDNCHVSGTIQVEGQTNVGGIVGKYYTKVTNCSVIGDSVATSYVKGVYVASDFEGDNIGGIMGHCGENNSLTGNTVKNITISGTRKVAGIVGIADQNTDIDNCVVENVVVETTATVDYASSKLSSMSIGALIGQYQAAKATNDGAVTNSTVKNVTFNNVNNVTVDVGPIVGGARGGSDAMLAPSADIIATGNNIQLATITGRNNLYLVSPVAKIGDANYYIFEEALDAAQVGDTIVLLADVECAEKPVYAGDGVVNVDVNGHILVSSVKERIRNVVSADGLVPSNNIKFVSGFGWEVYSSYNSFVASDDNRFRVFPTLEQAANYDPATTHDVARIYAYENVKQTADVTLRASGLGTSSTICLDPGYDITWDLNGYTLLQETPTGNPLEACIRGTFTLDDTSVAKTGKWIAGACGVKDPANSWYGNGGPAFYVLGDGKLILKGGTVSIARNTDINEETIDNTGGLIRLDSGSLLVDGATLLVEDTYGIMAWGGSVVVNSGKFDIQGNGASSVFAMNHFADASVEINTYIDGELLIYNGTTATVNAQGVVYYEGNGYVAPTLAAEFVGLPNLDGRYVVGKAPTATVNNLGSTIVAAGDYVSYPSGGNGTDMPLSFVMQFLADESAEEVQNSAFKDWYGDFVITFTGIENDSFVADSCYLAGNYGSFGWVKIPVDGMTIEEGARYPVMLSALGGAQTYETICTSVKDFKCALYLTPEVLAANPNLEVKLELSVIDSSKGVDAATEALVAGENIYEVVNYEYEAIDFALYEGADIVIEDGTLTSFSNPNTITTNSITYKRSLWEDLHWNEWYVPFKVPVSEFVDNGFEVAYMNDVRSYDRDEDGRIDSMMMEVIPLKSGVLKANYPYLFRRKVTTAPTTLELVLENAKLYSTEPDSLKSMQCSSAYVEFEVSGNYSMYPSESMSSNHYVLGVDTEKNESSWDKLPSGYSLKPFRFYLTITESEDSPVELLPSALRSISIRTYGENEGTATEICNPALDVDADDVIYDLQGRRVLKPEAGIYIVNGKKVIFK